MLFLASECLHGVQEEISGAGELPFQSQEVLKPLAQMQLQKNDPELENLWVSVKTQHLTWSMVFILLNV